MLISACIFGYGDVAKDFVAKFRSIPGYGEEFRIHMIQVPRLQDYSEVGLNDIGQWKLRDWSFNDENQSISFGDDLDWLRSNGWRGHDTIIDCSDGKYDFSEEIEFQMNCDFPMRKFTCTEPEQVDALIETLREELKIRKENKLRVELEEGE